MAQNKKGIGIFFKPLQCSCSIEVVGSVPARQIYQADKREYTPDYTIAPLVLLPRCNAVNLDTEEVIPGINASLTNLKWYESIGGSDTLIDSSFSEYSISPSGAEKGMISVRKNVTPGRPVTLRFSADYVDRRTGNVYAFKKSIIIISIDGTAAIPTLSVDAPGTIIYNPVRNDHPLYVINPRVFAGDIDVTDRCRFWWYKLNHTTGGNVLVSDEDLEIVTGNALEIDMDFISEDTYICQAAYSPDGAVPDNAVHTMTISVTVRRNLGKIECSMEGVPDLVSDDISVICPKALISDQNGIISNFGNGNLRVKWHVKRSEDSVSTEEYDTPEPTIPFTDRMILQLDVEDRGPLLPVCDQSGNVVTIEGNIIASH